MSPQSGVELDRNDSTVTISPTPISTHHGVAGLFAMFSTKSTIAQCLAAVLLFEALSQTLLNAASSFLLKKWRVRYLMRADSLPRR